MGVKELAQFVKERCGSDIFHRTNLNYFCGKKASVDTTLIFRRIYITSYRNEIERHQIADIDLKSIRENVFRNSVDNFIKVIILILKSGIDPIFVFDGENKGMKLEYTDRVEKFEERNAEIETLRTEFATQERASFEDMDRLKKLIQQQHYVTKEETNYLISMLCLMGFKCIKADGESEKLCSSLAIEGKVFCVISFDSDVIVHGSPVSLIMPMGISLQSGTIDVVCVDEILHRLSISYERFVDFCIMLGTDFSKRTPRKGPVNCFREINERGSIENLILNPALRSQEDLNNYNHIYCRNHFKYTNSDSICNKIFVPDFNLERLKLCLDRFSLSSILTNENQNILSMTRFAEGYPVFRVPGRYLQKKLIKLNIKQKEIIEEKTENSN